QRPCTSTSEMWMCDHRGVVGAPLLLPIGAGPGKPGILLLVENKQRLVAELRELRAPPGAALHRAVVQHGADDVNLLAVVDLIPNRLKDSSDRRRIAVSPIHQAGDVLEADIARFQFFVVEDTYASVPIDLVAIEREIDFLDAMLFGANAECGLGAGRAAAEQNAVASVH